MREISTPMDVFDGAGVGKAESIRWIWLPILLALIFILVAVAAVSPPGIWSASEVVLFVLAALLCTLGAISLGVTECRAWRTRTGESVPPIATPGSVIQEGQTPGGGAVPPGSREPEALTLPEEGNQHELEKRVAELAGILETVAANQGQLAGGLREFHEVTQRMADEVQQLRTLVPTGGRQGPLDVEPPVPVEAGDNSTRLRATQAVTHGEQIRYEAGPDRDNLGFWTNANDWAEWEVDIARPGCFKVTAEIAALAGSRFQVVLADQTLQGSAPNTGDYGRFQQVEVGTVELTSAGKTRVAVRPIPEGWQPMNLRLLDLALLPA